MADSDSDSNDTLYVESYFDYSDSDNGIDSDEEYSDFAQSEMSLTRSIIYSVSSPESFLVHASVDVVHDISSDSDYMNEDNEIQSELRDVDERSSTASENRNGASTISESGGSVVSLFDNESVDTEVDTVLDRSPTSETSEVIIVNTTSEPPEDVIVNTTSETPGTVNVEDSNTKKENDAEIKTQGEKRSLDDSFIDNGTTCPICLDEFTNSGPHRLSSLSCGHVFGHKCVEYWLKVACNAGGRRCPTCNKKAALKDVRILYARKLVALDTSELDRVKEQLEKTLVSKNKLQQENVVLKFNEEKLKHETATLKRELDLAKCRALSMHVPEDVSSFRLKLFKAIDVTNAGGCRVIATDNAMNLVVSTKQKNPLFPDFGLKKFDVSTFSVVQMLPLHSKMIRDVAYHRQDKNLLLSVSLDATAKVLDMRCNTGLHTFTNDNVPLWSCSWDHSSPYLLYAGGQSGTIMQYDTRNIQEAVNVCTGDGNLPAVVSLAIVPGLQHNEGKQAGLLACRLNSIWAHEQDSSSTWESPNALPIAGGPFMSMSYNETNNLILTSARPSSKFPFTRLSLHQFSDNIRSCNLIHTIHGSRTSTVMSRSCFVNPPGSKTGCVAAFNESASTIEMFDSGSAQLTCKVGVKDNIIDICPVNTKESFMLTALTDKQLLVFTCTAKDSSV